MVLRLKYRWRGSQPGSAGASEALAGHFDTHLLALLFEQHPPGAQLNVLDVGPAAGETVTFLSQYRCHLHYADLYDEPTLLGPCEPEEYEERTRQFQVLLGGSAIQPYDVCLFWDLFRYIHASALPALGGALTAVVKQGTLAHAFLCHGRLLAGQTPLMARCFGIVSPTRVSQRPCVHQNLTPYSVSQRDVIEKTGCLEIDKSRLLQGGGLLEVLLRVDAPFQH